MKKTFLLILIVLLLITGCKTREEIEKEKEQQRIDDITKEVEKNTEVPEDVKKWLVDNKTKQVLTIFWFIHNNERRINVASIATASISI